MECQSLFSGKIKKNIIDFFSAELAQTVVKVKLVTINDSRQNLKIVFFFFHRK